MIDRVLVAMDDSPLAARALAHALEAFPDSRVVVLHVAYLEYDADTYDTEDVVEADVDDLAGGSEDLAGVGDDTAQSVFDAVRSTVGDGDDVAVTFLVGEPEDQIVEYAEAGDFDQLVLGTHGREGVSRLLFGSVAETVVRRSPVPTTLVK